MSKAADPLAALLTDSGAASVYPAVMKGVLLGLAPSARIVDITHTVPVGGIAAAAFTLMTAASYFPAGTLFLCVVEPGVGTDRKIVWAKAGDREFLAPDNGLLSWLDKGKAELSELRSVENGELFLSPLSATCHGRDIFAPVAAALLNGFAREKLGPRLKDIKRLPFPQVCRKPDGKLEAEILFCDSFGNCITNMVVAEAEGKAAYFRGMKIGHALKSYGFAASGQAAAVESSSGFVELAVNGWSFAEKFRAEAGDKVVFK